MRPVRPSAKTQFAFFVAAVALAGAPAVAPLAAQSLPEALEAIQRARVATRILYVTAHPDDESSSVLTYLARGLGADVALVSITRGEGGQNALGPEQGPQLAVLRSEELLAATRAYGVRLYFTRAPDFGYSKTPQETLKVWGDTALDDLVRIIRTFRPHVIINHWGGVHSGHGHHQASGIITPQAFAAAADPQKFPQQLAEGLRPWHATLLLQLARGDAAAGYRVPSDQISPIWGKTYNEMGRQGFANHRTQGIAVFLGSPFLRRSISLVTPDSAKFDPAQLAQPLMAVAAAGLPNEVLDKADRSLAQAREAVLKLDWAAATRALAQAGATLEGLNIPAPAQAGAAANAPWELARLKEKVDAALADAAALRIDAQAERSEMVAGGNFVIRAEVHRRADLPGEFSKPTLVLPSGWSVTKEEADPAGSVRFAVNTPKDSQLPRSPADWMLPSPPPLVQAQVRATIEGYPFDFAAPVIAQRATSTRVDTLPLELVPTVTISLEPRQLVFAEKRAPKQIEILVRVHSYSVTAATALVGLDLPEGWRTAPPQRLEFTGPGDQLARFVTVLPVRITTGKHSIRASAHKGVDTFRTSLEPLPSLPTRLWSAPAAATVHVFDVAVPQNLHVGYVAAENDPIPAALRQLGIQVELLDPVALAFGDLRRFDAIAIGIRAYELREDLARANRRLLDYAEAGGTLVVQYQREYVWTALKPAPYPAAMSQPAVRVTDENSPVRFLAPNNPLLNFPNKISQEDFQGWVQERGLYFWSQFDPRYQPVLAMRDPGEEEVTGGLLYARYGKGVYIYTGLAFFRELPEGVPGAYRLFVNLLSQSRAAKP